MILYFLAPNLNSTTTKKMSSTLPPSASSSSLYNIGLVTGTFGNSVIYENFTLQGTTNNKFHSPVCSQWHRKYPLLAISKANGVVSVYDDHGEKNERVNLSRSSNCTAIGWHPTKFILCTGWKDGAILLYNDKDPHNQKEIELEEHGKICAIKWSPDGERLITAHQVSCFFFLNNNNSNLSLIQKYEQLFLIIIGW